MDGKGNRRRRPIGRPRAQGFVRVDGIYTLAEFKRRMAWTDSAVRAARGRGFVVLRDGKRAHVYGKDFVEFLRKGTKSI